MGRRRNVVNDTIAMPTGIYSRSERIVTPAYSLAAKARGQTGFLNARHEWKVTVTLANGRVEHFTTTRKRSAWRMYHRRMKVAADNLGKYAGATVAITCDGKEP